MSSSQPTPRASSSTPTDPEWAPDAYLEVMYWRTAFVAAISLCVALGEAGAQSPQRPDPAPIPTSKPAVPDEAAEHQPVDPSIADRGPLTTALRRMPYELASPQGFDRVYKVPGHSGKFFRASGALYAVFDEGVYRLDKKGGRVADLPAGTTYYIGRPDWLSLRGIADVEAGSVEFHENRAAGALPNSPGDVPAPHPVSDARSDESSAPPRELPTEFASRHPDVAAITGRVPAGVDRTLMVGDGADVRPRMIADVDYRETRLALLFRQAASERAGP